MTIELEQTQHQKSEHVIYTVWQPTGETTNMVYADALYPHMLELVKNPYINPMMFSSEEKAVAWANKTWNYKGNPPVQVTATEFSEERALRYERNNDYIQRVGETKADE